MERRVQATITVNPTTGAIVAAAGAAGSELAETSGRPKPTRTADATHPAEELAGTPEEAAARKGASTMTGRPKPERRPIIPAPGGVKPVPPDEEDSDDEVSAAAATDDEASKPDAAVADVVPAATPQVAHGLLVPRPGGLKRGRDEQSESDEESEDGDTGKQTAGRRVALAREAKTKRAEAIAEDAEGKGERRKTRQKRTKTNKNSDQPKTGKNSGKPTGNKSGKKR